MATLRFYTIQLLCLYMVTQALSFCVINQSCRDSVTAEIWDRRFPSLGGGAAGFKTVAKRGGRAECCASTNNGCQFPGQYQKNDEIILWLDCGKGGQSIVACNTCNVFVNENDMIMVMDDGDNNSPRAIYACNGSAGVEYRPCVIPSNCWDLIREFMQGFMGSHVTNIIPPYFTAPSMMAPNQNQQNDIYQSIDTVQQYLEHFSNYRKLNNPLPGMGIRN